MGFSVPWEFQSRLSVNNDPDEMQQASVFLSTACPVALVLAEVSYGDNKKFNPKDLDIYWYIYQ